jgi:hypothetical protein
MGCSEERTLKCMMVSVGDCFSRVILLMFTTMGETGFYMYVPWGNNRSFPSPSHDPLQEGARSFSPVAYVVYRMPRRPDTSFIPG